MWFSSWLTKRQRSTPSGRRHKPPRQRPSYRPRLEALEDRWLPSQVGLTVTSLADSGPGTLRAAILTADAGSPSDKFTIGFAVTGTIDLQSPLPDLNNSIAVQGPGATSLIVERAAGFSFASAIVSVDEGRIVGLSGLTITNGDAGGIANFGGSLTLANSAVVNNSNNLPPTGVTSIGFGGGIANLTGTLTISGCTVSDNTAYLGYGGGIYNGDPYPLTVTDSYVCGNTAGEGGGIINGGPLTVDRSMVSGNTATGFYSGFPLFHFLGEGGGILNGGTMTVSGSTLCGNSADLGGGIFSDGGTPTVRNCVFIGNSATQGGGIYFGGGTLLEVQGSTFSCNHASDSGGGIYNLGTATLQECTLSEKNSAGSTGGGIFNGASGTLAVKDSTVLKNVAPLGADLYNLGALTLDDSTIGVIGL
jgi:predicted outer membrane repeat protein